MKLDNIQKIFGDQDFNQDINSIVIMTKMFYAEAKYRKAAIRLYVSTLRHFSRQRRTFPRFPKQVVKNFREYLEMQCISCWELINLNGEGKHCKSCMSERGKPEEEYYVWNDYVLFIAHLGVINLYNDLHDMDMNKKHPPWKKKYKQYCREWF